MDFWSHGVTNRGFLKKSCLFSLPKSFLLISADDVKQVGKEMAALTVHVCTYLRVRVRVGFVEMPSMPHNESVFLIFMRWFFSFICGVNLLECVLYFSDEVRK